MKPEEKARQKIDQLLEAAGWKIQDLRDLNLGASPGVAVREFPLKSGAADYLNFVDTETLFRDTRDLDARSRRVFAFHKPETLKELSLQEETLRARLKKMPLTVPLNKEGLRDCQFEAIQNLEQSFAEARPRALIQMATGSGKTYTAVSFIYRLIKFAGAKRVLFLVDRSNLGRQTKKEFQQYVMEKEVYYNPQIPIETFDFIVTDECHRSIYGLWRQVLEYFDAFLIGLTATPSRQTLGFFNQNLVMEYSHERAVADGVNVGYEVYRIKTDITEKGSKVEAGDFVDKRDKLFTEIFPGRAEIPKTLVFAKDDSHAEDIVHIMREEFGKGNDFCKKITYKTEGAKPEDLIASFRNSYNPRIAVTVDMISTGTDIKPLECLLFMRDVRSRVLFEQMKGRGTRTISSTDFKAITPGASTKTHFMIVDAVGVCENDKTDSRPLERKKSVAFDKLIMSVALGNRDDDTITSLAGRLARMDREIEEKDRLDIQKAADGKSLKEIINNLLDAVDPDKKLEKAKEIFKT